MRHWWEDLSVAKKLSVVVGVMALLIGLELFTLLFAMDTLSSIRSFVGGESLWSKAQKNAIYSLQRYVSTENEVYYGKFQDYLKVALGDRQARLELDKPNPDYQVVREGFIQGQNHPQDVDSLVRLLQRFHDNPYIAKALQHWRDADVLFFELKNVGEQIHTQISQQNPDHQAIQKALAQVDSLNEQLTTLETHFSQVMGEGSRWMEKVLMIVLIFAVLLIGATGLALTVTFSRKLSLSLAELSQMAQEVGRGNFTYSVAVKSKDELGLLAEAINKMTKDLRKSIGQRVRAENANQVKTLFLANMSHEIRTPLGVILGLVDILKEPSMVWNDRLKYLETIERTGKNLTRIINDILDISKVETGHLEIEKTSFSLSEFLHELQSMMKIKAQGMKNELYFVKQGDVPERIFTDRIRLRQILVNLINNSLKFTREGTVTLTYGAKNQQLFFEVSDTGVGISAENRDHLFQPYFQADDNAQKNEGTGLGLVLSKRLAQALGGDVILKETAVGHGSTFLATIQNEIVEEIKKLPEAKSMAVASLADSFSGKKVLVVEDVLDNQMLTKLYLARKGMKVQFANNGLEGVQKALQDHYDVILMDMQMPVMDGYTATRQLRDQGYQRPIIALTAHAMKEDRERCLQAGCDDYLTKPLDSAALYETISRNLSV
jgi:signal transduction histidine kinase